MDITLVGIMAVGLIIGLFQIYMMLNLYKKCSPNEAMIIKGAVPGGIQIVRCGGAVIWPLINQKHSLSLAVMTVKLDSEADMLDKNGLPVHMTGTAHIKVKNEDEAVTKAAERFLGKSEGEIAKIAQEIISGQLRAVVANMTVEEIPQCLDSLAQRVRELALPDLYRMGLEVESLSLR